jgi:uracil-DNA glycosylase
MRVSRCVGCKDFPCLDVKKECYVVPDVDVNPDGVRLLMISETAPQDPNDYYYAEGDPLYQRTTIQAFNDAGAAVKSLQDILNLGVYLTTAVKCGKTGYGIKAATIRECSHILEEELSLFPNVEAYMLMGDVAIKAMNYIAKRTDGKRVIPAGSTYKIRGKQYFYLGRRVFPSYLQAGPSYFIERSKRRMIAEDIADALKLLK